MVETAVDTDVVANEEAAAAAVPVAADTEVVFVISPRIFMNCMGKLSNNA